MYRMDYNGGGQVLDSFERSFEKSLKVIFKKSFSQVNQKSPSLKGIKFTMISVRFNALASFLDLKVKKGEHAIVEA
jgi:hypothetical protein